MAGHAPAPTNPRCWSGQGGHARLWRAFRFQGRELWDGKRDATGNYVCNGLSRDLVDWTRRRTIEGFDGESGSQPSPIEAFERVLDALSPPDGPPLTLGAPRRVFVKDTREIPTLSIPWDDEPVPLTLAAAGIGRIIELAYLLVWTWHEHLQVTQLMRLVPQRELFILIDEPELHLHPRWQRAILPALVGVAKHLDPTLEVQLFITTHSPLILASGELLADDQCNRLCRRVIPVTKQDPPGASPAGTMEGAHPGPRR